VTGPATSRRRPTCPARAPLVGPLALNGGPTRTHALLPNSPAIDAATGGPSTDQRGVPRPQGPEPDIGAFELEYCAGRRPTITGSEAISGTAADDVILGSVGADRIRAGAGDDLVCAGGGSDKVLGGPGDDRVGGSAGDDRLSGSAGDDVLRGGTEDDKLYGGDGRDGVLGQAGRDRAFGGPNEDRVDVRDGVAQNDRADGGSGIDSCLADTGDLVVNCP
jgi:hypothetical protein